MSTIRFDASGYVHIRRAGAIVSACPYIQKHFYFIHLLSRSQDRIGSHSFFSAVKLRLNTSPVNFDKHFDCRISCVISVRFDLKRVVVYISAGLVLLCRAYPDIQKEEYQLYFLSRSQNKAYVLKCLCRLRNFDPTSVREFRSQILSSSFSRDCFLLRLDTSAYVYMNTYIYIYIYT